MSFILDALRKSENERQEGAVPGIGDVPAVVHRTHVPRWAMGVIVVLGVCLLVLSGTWLRSINPARPIPSAARNSEPAEPARPPAPAQVRDLSREPRQAVPNVVLPQRQLTAVPDRAPAPASVTEPTALARPPVTLAELQASGALLPELNLELHVYSANPAERFVFINSAKHQEGGVLQEGPRVLAIIEDGVLLSYRGQSFLLPRD